MDEETGGEQYAEEPTTNITAGETAPTETPFRPLTRVERRNLWLKEYGDQDFALQLWARLVEQQDLEIEMMLQMHGLLVFGVMVSTQRYAQFYIDLNEELHREREPETADALREYYMALVPPQNQPEIGPEGLPVVFRYIHMSDVTIMSAGHKIKVPTGVEKLARLMHLSLELPPENKVQPKTGARISGRVGAGVVLSGVGTLFLASRLTAQQ